MELIKSCCLTNGLVSNSDLKSSECLLLNNKIIILSCGEYLDTINVSNSHFSQIIVSELAEYEIMNYSNKE